jgi:hypothetical protein
MNSSGKENSEISLSIRGFKHLVPQAVDRFSVAYPPHIHRILAGYPHANPQIFRPFSASFAHGFVRIFFRSLCAAIPEELAN